MSNALNAEQQQMNFRRLLSPGSNCWHLEEATRLGVVIDAAAYFAAFAEACKQARRQILILGWDFDRRERLHRNSAEQELPDQLGDFLVALVKRRPDLRVYLLSWDFNMIYAAERELLPAFRLRLQAPPRFHFRLDDCHPAGGSQHQKVVVIDDRVAFVGGIDLSRWRWDTPEHKAKDSRRVDPNGKAYPPFHDLMMVVEGDAASRLGDLARERWRRAHGWRIKPVASADPSPWPGSVETPLRDCPVAIVRTEPAYRGRPAVQEVKRLYLDAIGSATRFVYIENQYFTALGLAGALCKCLEDPDGPEVILVLPKQTGGWLEQMTMDVLRGRVVIRLREADRGDRLRVFYPHQPGLREDQCIGVHSKLMIVDDRFLRIGSSNASNRSMGLDSECDLAMEAQTHDDTVGEFIQGLRRRLFAEHLDCTPEQVAQAESQKRGLIGVIESLRSDARSLRPLDCEVPEDIDAMVPDSGLIDPPEPFSPKYFAGEYVPEQVRTAGRKRLLLFLGAIVALLGMAAAWRWTPLNEWLSPERLEQVISSFASPEIRAFVAVGGFLLASLLMVPLTLLAVVLGVAFPGWEAFAYALAAAVGSSTLGFLGGRLLGQGAIGRLSGSRLEQLSKRLAERGVVAIALLRLVPIAPFAVLNLVAGASHLSFRQFIIGSTLGLAPGLGAVTLFSGTLWGAIKEPSWANVAIAVAIGVALAALAWLVKRWLRSG
jgi:phosphatidylserine/phosphatidylglycerophosphate/cardiolipin synthase-like enzyme/uncharacterized membrane protein YdjX (TVP38/TMEM64 family)